MKEAMRMNIVLKNMRFLHFIHNDIFRHDFSLNLGVCEKTYTLFPINFPGNAERIQLTGTRCLCQIIFHDSN